MLARKTGKAGNRSSAAAGLGKPLVQVLCNLIEEAIGQAGRPLPWLIRAEVHCDFFCC
jgi:hypothetical protein